jgi:Protein of unknown function (DUF3489)
MSSVPNLTAIQREVLSAASLRDDRCLVLPKTLRGGAAQKVATKLLTIGFVRKIKAKAEVPVWRRDQEADQAYALKLTAAGLKAMTVDAEEPRATAADEASPAETKDQPKALPNAVAAPSIPSPPTVREGTKIAQVLDLLQRDQGARLDELTSMTGWLPHTARAALTGLRHRGFAVRLERGAEGVASVYRATSVSSSVAS